MGRPRLANGRAVRSKAVGSANNRNYPELATRGVDGGLECGAQATAGGNIGRGEGQSDDVDFVATTGAASRTAKGRQQWEQVVQGVGEEICDVEAAGYVGDREGLENGGGVGREAIV